MEIKNKKAYFDYVLTDANGVSIYDQNGNSPKEGVKPTHIYGIAVLKKTPKMEQGTWPLRGWEEYKFRGNFEDTSDKVEYDGIDGTKHNGNYGEKGNYLYSTQDYKGGKDQYNKDRAEYTSALEHKSNIISTSQSHQ